MNLPDIAKAASERAAKNSGVAPQLLYAPILWALQDAASQSGDLTQAAVVPDCVHPECDDPEWCAGEPKCRYASQPSPAATVETCSRCGGSGMALNNQGEPDECRECKGNTVVPRLSADTGRQRAIELLIKLQTIGNAEVYRLASEAQQMLELPISVSPQAVAMPLGMKAHPNSGAPFNPRDDDAYPKDDGIAKSSAVSRPLSRTGEA